MGRSSGHSGRKFLDASFQWGMGAIMGCGVPRSFLSILLFVCAVGLAAGQWVDLDGDAPINPNSGSRLNPRVSYDPLSGVVSVINDGSNQVADSLDNIRLLGDDTGLIGLTLSLASPLSIERIIPPWIDGVAWNSPNYEDGVIDLSGQAVVGYFLTVSEDEAPLFQLPTGLSAEDFFGTTGQIEMSMTVNFGPGRRPATLVPAGDPLETELFVLSDLRVSGDLNDDGLRDCADVDLLSEAIASGLSDDRFDLNTDGKVDVGDLNQWLVVAGNINLSAPYLPGDANLDGTVDVSDFNTWNGNKFTNFAAWCSGNFNGDTGIDISDFNIWNQNKFTSSQPLAVPEPHALGMLLLAVCFAVSARGLRSTPRVG